MGPAAIGAGVLAVGLAGFALQQNGAANRANSEAREQLAEDGSFKSPGAQARWSSLHSDASRQQRNAAISAGAAVTFTVTAAFLGWKAWRPRPDQVAALTIEF
jgi:hypothetical protein